MADDKVRWVEKDSFVMPILSKSLKVDPVLAGFLHLAAFLVLSGKNTVDPDCAVEAMEHVGYYLHQLPGNQVDAIREQVRRVAEYARKQKEDTELVEFFAEFLENFGVGEDDE